MGFLCLQASMTFIEVMCIASILAGSTAWISILQLQDFQGLCRAQVQGGVPDLGCRRHGGAAGQGTWGLSQWSLEFRA